MKPSLFKYVRAETIDETVFLMRELGGDCQLLAGGQSLVPTMALRMAAPSVLLDISGVAELQGVTCDGKTLRIGAGTRYTDILRSETVAEVCPLLVRAIPAVAHEAIRNRGTIGGSLAHADPASELPACMMALNATLVLRSKEGSRQLLAEAFFLGTYLTELHEGEMIVAVEIPVIGAGDLHLFAELTRRSGDYAMLGGAFCVGTAAGKVSHARLCYFSISDRPLLAHGASAHLIDQPLTPETIEACAVIAGQELDCLGDLYNSAAMKRHLVKTLTCRILKQPAKESV